MFKNLLKIQLYEISYVFTKKLPGSKGDVLATYRYPPNVGIVPISHFNFKSHKII
jgi:hypothetical protein